ncbi:MAG: Re/Si-specific NAD(P)(+) transhydrogenase subunit alpha [Gemmatimonadetes bacterium]|nr:Re/Si-specific NAD(P)(+) transhydrogenase subunit alpha [Gemmatimonadota bacterium]
MRIAVLRETAARERRVALAPATVDRLIKQKHQVVVQEGAGVQAFFPDKLYQDSGASIAPTVAAVTAGADLIAKVQPPTIDEAAALPPGAVLVSLMAPHASGSLLDALAKGGVTALALELVPRTTKAQSMDILSSQATIAGYQAVLLGAHRMGRLMPMLTTAAGTLTPAKAFIIGAGVAGLQAIATARRLGAVVSAFDVRPVVKEQVQSLGASFVEAEAKAEGAGGYAKELSTDQQQLVLAAIAKHIKDMDLVIATAAIPGKPAPRLITNEMVESMRPGSVIVDVAAETGGNCEATVAGEERSVGGVTVIGPLNLASTIPNHASFMFSRNIQSLLDHGVKDGAFQANMDDPIIGPMCVTHGGAVRYGRTQ